MSEFIFFLKMLKLIKTYDQFIFVKFHHYGKIHLLLYNGKKNHLVIILKAFVLYIHALSYFFLNLG